MLGLMIMPYEIGKYMCLFYFIIFSLDKRVHKKNISIVYLLLFLLLFPSLLFTEINNFRVKIIFNLLGIIDLSLLCIFFSRLTITLDELKFLFKSFIYSLIPVLIILFITTPSFSEIKFGLNANFETSAGFGPNQVSTVLGAAVFILIVNSLVFKKNLFINLRQIDIAFLILFSFRALLTFSRGGIFAPLAAFFLPLNLLSKVQNIRKITLNLILLLFFSGITFAAVNSMTGGVLFLRLSGESNKSILTDDKKSLETITTGRSSIIEDDITVWLDNIVFGVGPGESSFQRMKLSNREYVAAHTEFSRLLSEHGLFGLIVNIILILVIPLQIINSKLQPQIKYMKIAFIIFSIASMSHSATRTVIPLIFYAFSAINIDARQLIDSNKSK
jgi:hypothetical protein